MLRKTASQGAFVVIFDACGMRRLLFGITLIVWSLIVHADGGNYFQPGNAIDRQYHVPFNETERMEWYGRARLLIWRRPKPGVGIWAVRPGYVVRPRHTEDVKHYHRLIPAKRYAASLGELGNGLMILEWNGPALSRDGRVMLAAGVPGGMLGLAEYDLKTHNASWICRLRQEFCRVLGWKGGRRIGVILVGAGRKPATWELDTLDPISGNRAPLYKPADPKVLEHIVTAGLSPDGKTLVYTTNRPTTTRNDIHAYLVRVAKPNIRTKLIMSKNNGNFDPGPVIWSDTGKFFMTTRSATYAVCQYATNGRLERGYVPNLPGLSFEDYSSKTDRVLMFRQAGGARDEIGDAI